MHSLGYVHNDMKPVNIAMGFKESLMDEDYTVYLIDYGFVEKYMKKDGNLIKHEKVPFFKGNILFSSQNSLRGYSRFPKDDIESFLYIIAYLIKGN